MTRKLRSRSSLDTSSYQSALPITPEEPRPDAAEVEIHPFPSGDGLLVKVQPPRQPKNPDLEHVPCDVVLAIDVSSSMHEEASVPGNPGDMPERYGLSVLDLTKHAARTILETLNENDRLGIVTFSSEAKVGFRPCRCLEPAG